MTLDEMMKGKVRIFILLLLVESCYKGIEHFGSRADGVIVITVSQRYVRWVYMVEEFEGVDSSVDAVNYNLGAFLIGFRK